MKNSLVLPRIQRMQPYIPPTDGRAEYKGLLLDFNERTEPSGAAIRALEEFVRAKKFQFYPEYDLSLEAEIATYAGLNTEQVLVTNGIDQGIDVIFRTFVDAGDMVVVPSPTFGMYEQYLQILDAQIIKPSYEKDTLDFPLKEVRKLLSKKPKLLVITNPNNPTGSLLSLDSIRAIAEEAPETIVFVDEAYFEFSHVTAVGLIKEYPNVIVTRTFSKAFGLAGLRVGYILADEQYITEMLKVRGPLDINGAAYCVAAAVLSDRSGLAQYTSEVMDIAKPYTERFFEQNGVRYYPSAGNFILIQSDNASEVAETLRNNGVRVRPQNKPGIERSLRLTIGTLAQMRRFTAVYQKEILKKGGQKYAFIDRDGTLIFEPQDTFQIDSLEKLQILDGVTEGLQALVNAGYKLVMVTNQDGLGSDSFPKEDFEAPQNALLATLTDANITFEEIFICPDLPEANCDCRKPKTQLLDAFLRENSIDLEASFVCGDRASDEGLAGNLGLRFVSMQTNGNFHDAVKEILV